MEKIILKKRVKSPPEKVWQIIGSVGGVDQWAPMINTCRIEHSPEGLQRICGTDQGELKEKMLLLNDETKHLKYAIVEQNFFPVTNLVTSVKIIPSDSNLESEIETTVTFDVEEGIETTAIKEGLLQIYDSSYEGIESLINH